MPWRSEESGVLKDRCVKANQLKRVGSGRSVYLFVLEHDLDHRVREWVRACVWESELDLSRQSARVIR